MHVPKYPLHLQMEWLILIAKKASKIIKNYLFALLFKIFLAALITEKLSSNSHCPHLTLLQCSDIADNI